MILKVFTKTDCPKCPPAKSLANLLAKESRIVNHELRIETYDTDDVDGMAEAAFYTVMATPTVLLCDEEGKLVEAWRGQVPKQSEVVRVLRDKS
ncbi:thioredoxin family protein [Patescibacteria group bacterium]